MTGAPKQLIQNTLEEILSSDLTRIGQLAGKAAMDMIRHGTAQFGGNPRDCVFSGLEATIAGAGTLPVTISTGLAVRYNSLISPLTADSSDYELGFLTSSVVVNRAAADAVNPRVDLIYATIANADSDSTNRNQGVLPARTISPAALNKTRKGTITITGLDGVAAATPLFPAVPAGAIPLWYVYVPALAGAILDDHLMDARVYWSSLHQQDLSQILSGLKVYPGILTTDVTLTLGLGYSTGAKLYSTLSRNLAMADVVNPGEVFTAGRQYDFYAIAKGNGVPIGKTVPDGIGLIATGFGNTNPPDFYGRPSPPLNFAPLALAAANAISGAVLAAAQDRMTYVGTLHTGVAAAWTGVAAQNGSPPLNRQGTVFAHAVDAVDGRFPAALGWTRLSQLRWESATVVTLRGGAGGIVDGTPFLLADFTTFDITANLAGPSTTYPGGDVELPSTWYYLYLRKRYSSAFGGTWRGPVRDMVPIISRGRPTLGGLKTDPETGFNEREYIYVGSIYNDAGSAIRRFIRSGELVVWGQYESIHAGAINASPLKTTIQTNSPLTASIAICSFQGVLTNTAATPAYLNLEIFPETLGADVLHLHQYYTNNAGAGVAYTIGGPTDVLVPVDIGGVFEVNTITPVNVSAFTLGIQQKGYVEPLGGNR